MNMKETSEIILSGEHSRRRGYLSNILVSLNALAVMSSLSIWGFLVRWDFLYGKMENHELFAIQVAWASGLSSIFLGLWRLYARSLDASIIRLYPAIYLCELEIIPAEISSIEPPRKVPVLTKDLISQGLDWEKVQNKDFRGRSHTEIDWIVVIFIFAFSVISVSVGYNLGVIGFALEGPPHLVGCLLICNAVGLSLVLVGWLRWRRKTVKWPIPRTNRAEANEIKG